MVQHHSSAENMTLLYLGEQILNNMVGVIRNAEVMVFLAIIMFAGTFWGFIEAFLFWYLENLGALHFLMGCTVAVGMITSLPFLVSWVLLAYKWTFMMQQCKAVERILWSAYLSSTLAISV